MVLQPRFSNIIREWDDKLGYISLDDINVVLQKLDCIIELKNVHCFYAEKDEVE